MVYYGRNTARSRRTAGSYRDHRPGDAGILPECFGEGNGLQEELCLTVYDKTLDRFVVILASVPDRDLPAGKDMEKQQ